MLSMPWSTVHRHRGDSQLKIQIPYTYEARIRTVGGKGPQMVTVRDFAERDIQEVLSDEVFAVAAARRVLPAGRKKTVSASAKWFSVNGTLLETSFAVRAEQAIPLTLSTYPTSKADLIAISSLVWPDLQHAAAFAARESVGGHDVMEIIRTYRKVSEHQVSLATSQAAFIDDVLHVPGSEPVYVRDILGRFSSTRLSEAQTQAVPASRIYRADQFDTVLTYLERLPEAEAESWLERHQIDVFRPDMLTWDRSAAMLRQASERLLSRIQRRMAEAPRPLVLEWLDLRDALKTGNVDDISEIMRRLIAVDGGSLIDDQAITSAFDGEPEILNTSTRGVPAP